MCPQNKPPPAPTLHEYLECFAQQAQALGSSDRIAVRFNTHVSYPARPMPNLGDRARGTSRGLAILQVRRDCDNHCRSQSDLRVYVLYHVQWLPGHPALECDFLAWRRDRMKVVNHPTRTHSRAHQAALATLPSSRGLMGSAISTRFIFQPLGMSTPYFIDASFRQSTLCGPA